MQKFVGIILVSSVVCFGQSCGVAQEKYDADMAQLKKTIADSKTINTDLQSDIESLKNEKNSLEVEIKALQHRLQSLSDERDANADAVAKARARIEMFKDMLSRFKKMQDSGKIKIKIVENKMIVEMASAILFPSGSAKLSKEGQGALAEVTGVLSMIDGRSFQVAGHTDNKPIATAKFASNWELSSARAVSVVEFMIEQGLPSEIISAAGYGDTQPALSNETAAGRAANRRIEIVLQPNLDELPDLSSLEAMLD